MKTTTRLKYLVLLFLMICGSIHAEEKVAGFSKDKIYVVYLKHGGESSGGGVTITGARLEKFIGENYLIGSAVNGYLKKQVIRIPKDNIAMIMEYENLSTWRESIKKYYDELRTNKANKSE